MTLIDKRGSGPLPQRTHTYLVRLTLPHRIEEDGIPEFEERMAQAAAEHFNEQLADHFDGDVYDASLMGGGEPL